MKLDPEQWAALRAAVEDDETERYETLLSEIVRIAIAHERDHAIRCDRVRAREHGAQAYAVWQR